MNPGVSSAAESRSIVVVSIAESRSRIFVSIVLIAAVLLLYIHIK
jgi:hypothetical protein